MASLFFCRSAAFNAVIDKKQNKDYIPIQSFYFSIYY